MKKIISILFTVILCFGFANSALAIENTVYVSDTTSFLNADGGFDEIYDRVQDFADVLTQSELEDLNAKFDEIRLRQKVDVAVCFVNSLNGMSISDYAENFYEEKDYGYGESKDGIILLVSFENRDWYIATRGYAIRAFTDSGIAYIGDQITEDLANQNYSGASECFANLCDEFITDAKNGTPYSEATGAIDYYDDGTVIPPPLWILISIVIGIVVALIVVLTMKGKLKTVRRQAAASNYLKNGSLNITQSNDIFLYSHISRTAKPKESNNSSSTHESSSGNTYGGGGGKF